MFWVLFISVRNEWMALLKNLYPKIYATIQMWDWEFLVSIYVSLSVCLTCIYLLETLWQKAFQAIFFFFGFQI